jgi:hypothetical protein
MAAGGDLHAAVFLIAIIQRQPRRHARSRLHAQIVVVLMQRLAARPRRFEVEHRLYGKRFPAQESRQRTVDARIQHPAQRQLIPTVHVNHARVHLERISFMGGDAGEIARIAAVAAQSHVVLSEGFHFFARKQLPNDCVAVLFHLLNMRM